MNLIHSNISPNRYFLRSFLILLAFYIVLFPSMSYNPQVWVEQGSNYLFYAYNKTFAQNVWKDDAGYLVWLPRLIALLVSAIASPYWFIAICNLIVLMLIAFFVSFINHHSLRSLIPNDRQRFYVGLILGLCVLPYYEIFTYINFSYIGFLFITFLLFADKEQMRTGEYRAYCLLCALLCISKFHFVLFIPFFIGFMIYHQRCGQKRSMQFYIPSLCTMLIQLLYVAITMKYADSVANRYTVIGMGAEGLLMVLRGILLYFTAYSTHFRILTYFPLVTFLGLVALGYFAYLVIASYKKQLISRHIFLVIIICNLISLGFALMASLNKASDVFVIFFESKGFAFGRQGFVVYDMLWLSIVIFFLNVKEIPWPKIPNAKKTLIILVAILTLGTVLPKVRHGDRQLTGLSDWKNLHVLVKNPQYYLPVNPPEGGLKMGISHGVSFYKKYDINQGILDINDIAGEGKNVAALIFEYPYKAKLKAIAYDQNSQEIAHAQMISGLKARFKYLLFDPISNSAGGGQFPNKILILDENNRILENISASVAVYVYD